MRKLKNEEHHSLIKSIAHKLMFSEMQNSHFLRSLRILQKKNLFFHDPQCSSLYYFHVGKVSSIRHGINLIKPHLSLGSQHLVFMAQRTLLTHLTVYSIAFSWSDKKIWSVFVHPQIVRIYIATPILRYFGASTLPVALKWVTGFQLGWTGGCSVANFSNPMMIYNDAWASDVRFFFQEIH